MRGEMVGELKSVPPFFHLRPGSHQLELRGTDGTTWRLYEEQITVIAGRVLLFIPSSYFIPGQKNTAGPDVSSGPPLFLGRCFLK